MRARTRLAAAASVTLVLLLGAYSGSPADQRVAEDAASSPGTTQEDTAPEPDDDAVEAAAAALPPAGESVDDVWWWLDSAPSHDAAVVVTNVHAGLHDGFDRIVVDLAGEGVPGWGTELVDSAVDDGSGHPVEILGDQVMLLRLAGIAFPPDADAAQVDPFALDVGGSSVAQAAVRFWYEGNLNVFLGLVGDGEPSVTVTLEESPLRLVVDVARPVA